MYRCNWNGKDTFIKFIDSDKAYKLPKGGKTVPKNKLPELSNLIMNLLMAEINEEYREAGIYISASLRKRFLDTHVHFKVKNAVEYDIGCLYVTDFERSFN